MHSDRGAAAVEFALLLVVTMPLAFGTIAAGVAFSKQINVTQAAREASRYGATLRIAAAEPAPTETPLQAWLRYVDNALMQAAGRNDNPIGGYDLRCVAYVKTTTAGGIDPISEHRKDGVNGPGQCPDIIVDASLPPIPDNTDFVQVVLARKTNFFVVFINPELQLDTVSITPFEGDEP